MCHANYTTMLLGESVRDRQLLTLEDAVHQLTDVPARLYGLRDRGRVAEGWIADLVVFDPALVGSGPAQAREDLPGGGERLYVEARGIAARARERTRDRLGRAAHRRSRGHVATVRPRHRHRHCSGSGSMSERGEPGIPARSERGQSGPRAAPRAGKHERAWGAGYPGESERGQRRAAPRAGKHERASRIRHRREPWDRQGNGGRAREGGLRRRDHGPDPGRGRGARALVHGQGVRHVASAREPLVDRRARARRGPRGADRARRPARPRVARRRGGQGPRHVGARRRRRAQRALHRPGSHGPVPRHADRAARKTTRRQRARRARVEQAAAPVDDRARRRHGREHHVGVGIRRPHQARR